MAQKSLYDVLLVDQNASLEEIKLAFKRRALQVHPDKGGSKEEFHLVYQALETLGDPAARQKYDHCLAATKTGPAPHASHPSHAPNPKEKKRKREEKPAQPATSCKAETKTKPPKTPGMKPPSFAGKAPSKPPPDTATATPAEPQSPQTKLLMKIRDLLKQLPRDARNDVISNRFSQKQRVILEKFMVDNADASSGTKCHSEGKALIPTAGLSDLNQTGRSMASPVINSAEANQSTGCVYGANSHSSLYVASIRFDSFEMRTGYCCDLRSALENLMILTSVKQKMRNHTGAGTFVENLQAGLESSATEHGRNLADLKLRFNVCQSAGCFIGSNLRSPSVRSLEVFGKMRSVLEPFRQYAKNLGKQNVYWHFSPAHLEDAWERFQSAVFEAWSIAGLDSTSILQRICAHHEAQAPFRIANLQRWEQQHMARQDKNRNRPWRLRERNPSALERWERRQMGMQDKNKHRPKKLRQKLQLRKFSSESRVTRHLTALRKLIARWGNMLKRESKLLHQQRQRVLRQRKAWNKKNKEERRRVEVLKQKRRQEEERLRREWIRKRMRTDLTMDDILGQNSVRNYPNWRVHIIICM